MKIQFQPSTSFLNPSAANLRPKMIAGIDQVSFGNATKIQQEQSLQFNLAEYAAAKKNLKDLIYKKKQFGRTDEFDCLAAIITDLETLEKNKNNQTTLILAKFLYANQTKMLNMKIADIEGLRSLVQEFREISASNSKIPLDEHQCLKIAQAIQALKPDQPIFLQKVEAGRMINWPLVETLFLTKSIGCFSYTVDLSTQGKISHVITLSSKNLDKFNQIFGCKIEPVVLDKKQESNNALSELTLLLASLNFA